MSEEAWKSWNDALDEYYYPVNLAHFKDADKYKGWFNCDIDGDLTSTQEFEARFRAKAKHNLEAWYEVRYWKIYTVVKKEDKRSKQLKGWIKKIEGSGVTSEKLWKLCHDYMGCPSLPSFRRFRKGLSIGSGIAVAATYPAFICPDEFPMVDTQVAKWAGRNGIEHKYGDLDISKNAPNGRIEDKHCSWVQSWIDWCRCTRDKLNKCTDSTKRDWTAREVEMAVFTAQRCGLELSPLC